MAKQLDARTVSDLINKLSKDEFKRVNYKDKFKTTILFNNKGKHNRQRDSTQAKVIGQTKSLLGNGRSLNADAGREVLEKSVPHH